MRNSTACHLSVSEALPPGCLYARGRFAFELQSLPPEGRLRIAARQWGRVWLNGVPLGRLFVRHHEGEWRYHEFDLRPHLRVGRNVVAVLLHTLGAPGIHIPGTQPRQPILMRAEGGAGAADFSAADGWRFAPADEFLPAPRHNDLIGHEELRDLRREEPEWRLASYDDCAWRPAASCHQAPATFLPAPHRPLREEIHVPARIVEQGRHCPAWAAQSFPPSARHAWWRIRPAPAARPLHFFHGYRLGSRLLVDGQERELPLFPPMDWVTVYGSTFLEVSGKAHEILGSYPKRPDLPYAASVPPLAFGWAQAPEGGDRIEWAESPEGPWTQGRLEPDWEHQRMLDQIARRRLCTLGPDGVVDLRVTDETAALVFEFPRSITMLPVLEFADASAGVEVELVYSERLSPMPGLRFPAVYRDRALLRAGPQTWSVALQYKSARYLEVIIRAPGGFAHLRRVAAVYRHYDYDETGRFESSEPRLNAIWEICRNTMEAGSQDFIMDGPWREQMLYIGDNFVHNQAAYHLYDNLEIVRWQHQLYAQGQMPDGIFQPNQPCRTPPAEYRLLDQTILWPIQLEHHWQHTADRAFIAGLLPNVVRLLDGFQNLFGTGAGADPRLRGLTGWNWVDHPGMLDGRELRSIRHDGIPTAINLLYVMALRSAARLLRECGGAPGDLEQAGRFDRLRQELAAALRERHWDGGRKVYADCEVEGRPSPEVSLHVNLLAILAGLAEAPAELLARTWKQPGVLQPCGVFFHIHLLEVLHRLGERAAVLREIRQQWGAFLDAGLTTTPENTVCNDDWWASVGHPWGASPSVYLIRSIAGLSPLAPGWKRVAVNPFLGDLRKVRVTVPTPQGLIEAEFYQTESGVAGRIAVPPGVEVEFTEPSTRRRVEVMTVTLNRCGAGSVLDRSVATCDANASDLCREISRQSLQQSSRQSLGCGREPAPEGEPHE
ncbi:MAG TPA: alpha-L-rhamnosidase C-terminal domain-containing protein [Phycisphaerae bacterium]|nr:alpha-L-rhamnosidase C-terminal domain-containing protein [Phycisphaerae bacterium]